MLYSTDFKNFFVVVKRRHFYIYQHSPACLSDKSDIKTKMNMKFWWNDSDTGKLKYSSMPYSYTEVFNL